MGGAPRRCGSRCERPMGSSHACIQLAGGVHADSRDRCHDVTEKSHWCAAHMKHQLRCRADLRLRHRQRAAAERDSPGELLGLTLPTRRAYARCCQRPVIWFRVLGFGSEASYVFFRRTISTQGWWSTHTGRPTLATPRSGVHAMHDERPMCSCRA